MDAGTAAPAIYFPSTGTLTIDNSTISGGTGIEIRSGTLNVSGEKTVIKGTSSTITVQANGSGSTTDGAGIAVAQHTTGNAVSVNIESGTISGAYALYESNPQGNDADTIALVTMNVTGGTFTSTATTATPVYSEDCTAFITAGLYNADLDADTTMATYLADTYVAEAVTSPAGYYEVVLSNYIASVKNADGTRKTYASVKDLVADSTVTNGKDVTFVDNLTLTDATAEGLVATTASATIASPTVSGTSAYERASLLGGTFKVVESTDETTGTTYSAVYDYDLGISAITVTTDSSDTQVAKVSVMLTEEGTAVASRTLSGKWLVLTVTNGTTTNTYTSADPTFTDGVTTIEVPYSTLTSGTNAVTLKITDTDPTSTTSL